MKELIVYLAGPIDGLTLEQATDWRNYVIKRFHKFPVRFFNPMKGKENIVKPGEIIDKNNYNKGYRDILTSAAIFYRDVHLIHSSDVIFTHYPVIQDPGLGTPWELGYAYSFNKLIILSTQIERMLGHPFIENTCCIFRELENALKYLEVLIKDCEKPHYPLKRV